MPFPKEHMQTNRTRIHGFTLIEVMVVMSIIVVLAGILLVALGTATDSARRAKTTATLNSFRAACDAFALDHNIYPGVVPETALGDGLRLSSTQNALLHLMGGYRVYNDNSPESDIAAAEKYRTDAENEGRYVLGNMTLTDAATGLGWTLVIVPSRMGEGPLINGKPYSPYFAPKDSEFAYNEGQTTDYPSGLNLLPQLVDSWKTPILYFRQGRTVGPVVSTADTPGLFSANGQQLYLQADRLGELGFAQNQTPGPGSRIAFDGNAGGGIGNDPSGSGDPTDEQIRWLTLMLTHPAFYDPDQPEYGQPKSAYMLVSAGADGVFMARNDGPITDTGTFDYEFGNASHEDLEEFDDVKLYGGG
ncbi:MAG: hypothetical protein CMJ40_06575 [Phycisphaerae bacterium]|nr:hypothetical protein [Phycisphaerae bacterium]|tara:strand:+ start:3272 stop:4354 length:1083 start_codon:yes stop_codon:yes gene_type:complete